MPRGRRRKDPGDAPIDADYSLDVVLNKEKGYRLAYVSPEDMPKMRARGYRRVERDTDPERPAYDIDVNEQEFRVGANRLLLMKIPEERAKQIEAGPLRLAASRVAGIKLEAAKAGSPGITVGAKEDGVSQQVEA